MPEVGAEKAGMAGPRGCHGGGGGESWHGWSWGSTPDSTGVVGAGAAKETGAGGWLRRWISSPRQQIVR